MKKTIVLFLSIIIFLSVSAQKDTTYKYVKYTYSNGNISSEGFLRNKKPDGYWKSYFINGQIKSEGNRLNYKLDSTWVFYDENGITRSIINYKKGIKNGYRYTYLKNEIIIDYFINNFKEKETKIYYKSGEIKKIIPFENGLENGLAFTFNKDSVIILLEEYKKGFLLSREIINRLDKNGLKQGLWKFFYENGFVKEEITYLNNKKSGFLKIYDNKGILISIEKYINDIKQIGVEELKEYEIRKDYYSNGQIKIEGSYYNNLQDGIRREFDKKGKIIKGYIFNKGIMIGDGIIDVNGKKQGVWKEYYYTGELMSIGSYSNSIKVGEWKFYHSNGKLEQEGTYNKNGILINEWNYYHENTVLYKNEYYIDGELEGEYVEYNDTGKIIVKGQYVEGFEMGEWEYRIGDIIQKGTYQDGVEVGWWVNTSVPEGNVTFKGKYFDGKPTGKHTYYYPNTKKKLEANYEYGIRNGDWKYYDENGYLFLIITYRQGIEIKYNNTIIKPIIDPINN